MKFLLFITIFLYVVFVQAKISLDITFSSQTLVTKFKDYKQQTNNYIEFVQGLTDNARAELKENNNIRPSTEYSIHDIAFTIAKYLPAWVFPDSLWKEDTVTRRRHIAKVLRSSPLNSRPRFVTIRDNVATWTKESSQLLTENYFESTTDQLNSLINSTMDFISFITNEGLVEPSMTAGLITLDNAIEEYIIDNNNQFMTALNHINQDFNNIVSLSGELRIPLESMRKDAVTQTTDIYNQLFQENVAETLRLIGSIFKTELQYSYTKINEVQDNEELTNTLRKLTTDSLLMKIQDIEKVKTNMKKIKSKFERVWKSATDEVVQSPVKMNYWIDVIAEVKEAAIELLRLILKSNKMYRHCSC